MLSRFGGEEFMVILPESDYEQAMMAAEKIRAEIEALIFDEEDLRVTISGGVNELKDQNLNEFIRLADENLYKAKASGKNCIIGS